MTARPFARARAARGSPCPRRVAVHASPPLVTTLLGHPALPHSSKKLKVRRKQVAKRARQKLGASYSYGAGGPRAFDCSGFTSWVFGGHGAELPHNAAAQFARGRAGRFRRVWKRSKLRTGDLVFFDTTGARVGHGGIYIGKGRFIHASSSRGVRIDSVWDRYYYGPRWVGATRVPSLRTKHKDRPQGAGA